MAEIQRSGQRYPNQGGNYPTGDRTGYPAPTGRVDYPSSRYRSYNEGTFTISVRFGDFLRSVRTTTGRMLWPMGVSVVAVTVSL